MKPTGKRYCVRVAIDPTAETGPDSHFQNTFLECLRYASIVSVRNDRIFDIHAPAHIKSLDSSITWANQNAERMQSFGYNAVAAPEWKE